MADENSYRPPESSPPAAAALPHDKRQAKNTGCLVLFLLAVALLDTFGYVMSLAGPYSPVVLGTGLVGFACGAALGAYLSVKIKKQRWWSSCRWAICGLLGMCLLKFTVFAVVFQRR